jgi:hypothetical protein
MVRLLPILLIVLTAAGCIDHLSLDDRPCPCTSGWKCCYYDICVPESTICEAGQPCSLGCDDGQYCFLDTCEVCDDNHHCGLECKDCAISTQNWACVQGACGCRVDQDCPGVYQCIDGKCDLPGVDGGPDAGMTDGGGTDGGPTDAGGDGGGTDGGGDPGVTCNNNRNCGPGCVDCTRGAGNWACVGGRCGCRDDTDCQPNQVCEDSTCLPDGPSGLDGGT